MSQPALALLMTPVTAVVNVRAALVFARLLTALVTAVNVGLAGLLVRRFGVVAVTVTCAVLAFSPAAIVSGRTLLEEPYLNLFCLLGAVALLECPHREGLAGVAFGIALAIKVLAIAAVVPAVVLVLAGRRGIGRFGAGGVAGFAVPCLPFLVASPGRFVHDVFVVQASTVEPARLGIGARLAYLTGAWGVPWHVAGYAALATALVVLAVGGVGVSAPAGRFAAASALLATAVLLWRAAFYYHYAAFAAPFLAITIGIAAARVAWVSLLAVVAALVGVTFAVRISATPAADPARALDRLIPRGACVVTDDPAYLVDADRVPPAGCPDLVDPLAATWIIDGGRRPSAGDTTLDRAWVGDVSRADAVILSGAAGLRLPLAPVSQYLDAHFRKLSGAPAVWVSRQAAAPAG